MSINGIGQSYYQNNVATTNRYNKSNTKHFYQQKQAKDESDSERTGHNACVQDIYEALKSRVSNEDAKEQDSLKDVTETDSITDMQMNMLVSEIVQARFPLQEEDEEGNRKEEMYLIAVDKDGIRCSKPGQDEYEWEILFTDESQYENAIEFLNYAREFMDNFLFAAHENFWEDYLNGNMDVDKFKVFLEGTNNGIPDYSFTVGESVYIDKEKAQWAQYMNPLGAKFYTAEEMMQMQADSQESETKTEIIVKPDGSRVLVMTMSIGGMETTMSLEISKPTKAPNENSRQDTDNNMPSVDAEMDTISDDMSNISTEA